MPPASAPSPSGARRTPRWARRWGEKGQWGMKAWCGNRHQGDLPMITFFFPTYCSTSHSHRRYPTFCFPSLQAPQPFHLPSPPHTRDKQRFLTPGHQGWNDLHSLCHIGMEYYLLNNDDNNNDDDDDDDDDDVMIIRMTMMIIGTTTIMTMIVIITTTLTMTIMKMIMIKTAQTPS